MEMSEAAKKRAPKFKVGDAVELVTHSRVRRKQRIWKRTVLEVIDHDGTFFYRIDKTNCVSEGMIERDKEILTNGGAAR